MDTRRPAERGPIERSVGVASDRINDEFLHFRDWQGSQRAIAALPINDQERNLMAEQPEHEQLRHVGLASASDGKDADVFDEILPRKVERIERFARIDDGTKQHLAGRLLGDRKSKRLNSS